MKNNLIGLVLALAVGVLLVGTLVVPTVSSLTSEQLTYTNEGMPYAAVDEDEHILVFSPDGITVDGESIDVSLFPGEFTEYTVVYAEAAFIRLIPGSSTIQVRSTTSPNFSFSEATVTITITGSTAVLTTTASSSSPTITNVTHYLSSEGDFVLALNPVVLSDSAIVGAGQTGFNATTYELPATLTVRTVWDGTIEGISASVFSFVPTDTYSSLEVSNVSVNTTDLGNGLYRIDSVLIYYTVTDTDSVEYDVNSTYTYFLAPYQMQYDNPNYVGDGLVPLVSAIVLMTLVVLVVVAARAVTRD